jgi:phosphoglycerate dehydrogenase-like enzyme
MTDNPNFIIVTAMAKEFAEEFARLTDYSLTVKACLSAEQALDEYDGEAILFGNPDMIGRLLPTMPAVEWVQSSWAGITPLLALDRRDYVLTGVKDVFGPQMSEYVMGYLLAHELKVLERIKAQREHRWLETRSGALEGKQIGIMGSGSIGQHVAKTAAYFGMTVSGLSRSGTPVEYFENMFNISEKEGFLNELDYLVTALPHTTDTDNLIDSAALSLLPNHAYLVNVGRSNVIDDEALMQALRNKTLAGAVLDVFDEEPIPEASGLWDTPNLSITAHIAAISDPLLIVPIFVENYRRFVGGKPLNYIIDFDAGY